MEKDTVAIIGPQYSVMAHVISHIANELQVPLLSFAATDPSLSSLQFPYFVRTTHSDLFQMTAVAEIVNYYQWRDVIAIFIDDDHGRNGVAALGDTLAEKRRRISYKAPLKPDNLSQEDITNALHKVALMESRVIVLHIYPSFGLRVLQVAKSLGMMGNDSVWIVTDWLSTILDTDLPLSSSSSMNDLQGVLALRLYTPDSVTKRDFVSRWINLTSQKAPNQDPFGLNVYGLYAYDTVWILAYALDAYFTNGGTFSFPNNSTLNMLKWNNNNNSLHLDTIEVFSNGNGLLQNILEVNRTGLTGQLVFGSDENFVHPAYEIINVINTGIKRIGFWSKSNGLHTGEEPNHSNSNGGLYNVTWPGQANHQTPRGWVFARNGRPLRVGVPLRISYPEFVSRTESSENFSGYCIDVFTAALKRLPYSVPYEFIPFGDGRTNPSNSELLNNITTGVSIKNN